jgi:uncharacterized protein (TIGR03067 family)
MWKLAVLLILILASPQSALIAQDNQDDFLKAIESAFPSTQKDNRKPRPTAESDLDTGESDLDKEIYNFLIEQASADSERLEKSELKAMAGEYSVVRYVTDGVDTPNDDLKSLRVVRRDAGSWSLFIGNKETTYADKLNPKESPREVDITITSDNRRPVCLGIYERRDDLLRICFALPGNDLRPTSFSSEKGSKCSLVELRLNNATQSLMVELAELEKQLQTKENEVADLRKRTELLRSRLTTKDENPIAKWELPPVALVQLIDSLPAENRPESQSDSLKISKANKWFTSNLKGQRVIWSAGKKEMNRREGIGYPVGRDPIYVHFHDSKNGKFIANFTFNDAGQDRDNPKVLSSFKIKTTDNDDNGGFITSSEMRLEVTEEQAESIRKWPVNKDIRFEFEITSVRLNGFGNAVVSYKKPRLLDLNN